MESGKEMQALHVHLAKQDGKLDMIHADLVRGNELFVEIKRRQDEHEKNHRDVEGRVSKVETHLGWVKGIVGFIVPSVGALATWLGFSKGH